MCDSLEGRLFWEGAVSANKKSQLGITLDLEDPLVMCFKYMTLTTVVRLHCIQQGKGSWNNISYSANSLT